jgi:hypothetical protein
MGRKPVFSCQPNRPTPFPFSHVAISQLSVWATPAQLDSFALMAPSIVRAELESPPWGSPSPFADLQRDRLQIKKENEENLSPCPSRVVGRKTPMKGAILIRFVIKMSSKPYAPPKLTTTLLETFMRRTITALVVDEEHRIRLSTSHHRTPLGTRSGRCRSSELRYLR